MRNSWTDDRLDYLNHRLNDGFALVDERFKQVDERFMQVDERFKQVDERLGRIEDSSNQRFDRVDAELHRVNDRIDAFHRSMIQIGAGIIVALFGIVVTQL